MSARDRGAHGGRRADRAARHGRPAEPPKPVAALPRAPEIPLSHPAWWAAALIAAACVVTTLTFKIWDTDFWQHLVVGREIWRLHRVPNEMLWTWPTYGAYDVTPSWGFRALLWPFWQAGGLWGAYAWRWLTTLGALAILWSVARRMGARGFAALAIVAWAALMYRQRSQLRPETLVMVLLAAQLWIHEARRSRGADGAPGPDHTRWLPLIALLWANVHISYWIGLAVQAIYWIEAWKPARKPHGAASGVKPPLARLALIGLASAAVSFANPAGWRTLWQPFEYWFTWRHEPIFRIISELAPVYWPANLRNGLPLLIALWPLLLLWRWRRHGFDIAETALAALMLALALPAQRFVGLLAMVAVPFVSRDLDEFIRVRRWPAWTAPAWSRAALAAITAVLISIPEWLDPAQTIGVGLKGEWFPIAACDFMQRHDIRGRGFNQFYLGGYLLWRFYPEKDRLPFMDIHQSGTREDRRLYALASTRPDAWAALNRERQFDWVMLNRFRIESDRSLDILDADSTFALVFMDDNAALYLRRNGPLAALADSLRFRVLAAGPIAAAPRLAAAAQDSAQRRAMRTELARITRDSPFHAVALSLEANLFMIELRSDEARNALRGALAIDPSYAFANERLGAVALALARPREARDCLEQEFELQGHTARLDELMWRATSLERALRARRAEIAGIAARESGNAAWRDSLRSIDERLAPAPPIVPAKLPDGL